MNSFLFDKRPSYMCRYRLFCKILLTMKITLLLMLLLVAGVNAKGLAQKISLSLKNASLVQAFDEIAKQTDYRFLYSDELIQHARPVTLNKKNADIEETLKSLLKGQHLKFKIIAGTISITASDESLAVPEALPDIRVSGTVKDSLGSPLPGATVNIKNTPGRGVTADANGYFSISVPENSVLVISFIGFNSQEIKVSSSTKLNIVLKEANSKLDEVVVIGYGTRLKGELTGSVAKIGSEKIASRPVTGTMEALQGLIPGVAITRESGKPGRQDYQLKIRGASSVNGNVPLVLIDGIPGDISLINPSDIEDITILKDAAAAIYGARAADGVMLVRTKRGKKSDKPSISYSYNLAAKNPGIRKKAATTDHFVRMFNEANANDGDPQTFSDETLAKIAANDPGVGPGENWSVESYPMFYQSKDWYGDFIKDSQRQTHNLTVSGGGNNSTYLISFGNMNDNGNISAGKNSSSRDNLRLNLQTNLLENLKFDANISYDYLTIKEPSQIDDAISNALKVFSYIPLKNPAGNYYGYQGYENPFQEVEMGGNRTTKNSRLGNNFKIDWEPVKRLVWTGQVAINIERYDDNAYYATNYEHNWDNSINSLPRNVPNKAYYSNWNTLYKNYSTYLNYGITLGSHDLKFMAGASREKLTRETEYMSGADFTSNELFPLTMSDPKNLSAGDEYWDNDPWALLSYFGRFGYSFSNKYFLDATLRKDGSSKFSPDKRWSEIYPSISAAWRVSEEPFFQHIVSKDIVDLFKTRVSWGRTGNQDITSLGLFDYFQLISIDGRYPIDGANVSKMAYLRGIASPNRTWETIETRNLGFDAMFLHSKLSLSFDLYHKKNNNMLVSVAYPSTLGAPAPTSNAGTLVSKGWELTGGWNGKTGNVEFNANVVVNYNTNTLTNLQGQDTYNLGLTTARQGYPLNSYFGFKGSVIRSEDELNAYASKYGGKGVVPATQPNGYKGLGVGDVMFEDIDGDGVITTYGDKLKGYSGDAVFLGSQDPKYTYSLTGGLKYKNLDFGFILQGTGDKYVWRGNGNFGVPLSHFWFQPLDYFYGKTFTPGNPDAKYPRLSNSDVVKSNNYQFSSVYLENTKYLRVKNITVGYTFKNIHVSKFNLQNIRVYFSGQDLFEFAKGTWDDMYDPEESIDLKKDPNYNYYENNYPMYRTYSFGASVNF